MKKVVIIGAGIGGLTTAIALKKADVEFEIYEGAKEIKPVGAGIMLAQNAMKVFRSLGLEELILKQGNQFNIMNITKENLQVLSSLHIQPLIDKEKIANIAIHRSDLHKILMQEAGVDKIHTNKRLQSINKVEDKYILQFEDSTTVETEYLIGADGLKSKVRNLLFKDNELRDSHQLCWRGVADYDLEPQLNNQYYEAWGKRKRFGYIKINAKQVYWFLLVNDNLGSEKSDIIPYLNEFFPLAKELVNATDSEKIITAKLLDLKPMKNWSQGNVCLIGDAAHATTPNLGQGACQAIEDAYVLGKLIKKYPIDYAFDTYPKLRIEKAHDIVNTSWQLGKLAHLSNPISIFFRDKLLKFSPDSVMMKRFEKMYTILDV